MSTQPQALIKILYPLGLPPHLSDEDVAAQLDKEDKHKARARKSAETRKRKKEATHD